MFYSPAFRRLFLLGSCLFAGGCHRAPALVTSKIAVLRFENLSPDHSLDWIGRALSEVLGKQLGADSFAAIATAQQPFAPHAASASGVSSEKSAAMVLGATNTVTGYFTVANGKLSVTAVDENTASGKTIRSLTATGDIFSVADSLAHRFSNGPKQFSTRNATALRLYALGLESAAPNASAYFEQATAADPNFGDAYLAWTRAAASGGNRAELERALATANAHGAALQPLDRAFLNLETVTLHQDANARVDALAVIAKLNPGRSAELKALADAEIAVRRIPAAIGHYQQALTIAPADIEIRNLLAYAQMYGGDYPGALASVREYQKLRPQDPNALDSEGDIHFYFGKFSDAERIYLQAFMKSPEFSAGVDAWKAARARLMTGDVSGATQLFHNFRTVRQKAGDPSLGFRDAEWEYAIGNRAHALPVMLAAAGAATNPELRSLCFVQAAIWELAAGQTAEAARDSTLALQTPSVQTGTIAGVVRFIARPRRSAAEWRASADKEIGGLGAEKVRALAAAYAYATSREFTEAASAWKTIYENVTPADQGVAFFYAWTLVETGQTAAAAPILKTNPIPAAAPAAGFEAFYFPALFAWRGDQGTFTKLGGTPALAK